MFPDSAMRLLLARVSMPAPDIRECEFVHADGGALPEFTAGSHVLFELPHGMRRSYSLLNCPSETHRYVVAVKLDTGGRGGSRWFHEQLKTGDSVLATGPHNHFALDEDHEAIFIAGGIGITPILSMVRRCEQAGVHWQVHYATSEVNGAFVSDLAALDKGRGRVHHHHRASPSRLCVTDVVRDAAADAHLYCCGPSRMIEEFREATRSLDPARVHLERFASSAPSEEGNDYELVLSRTGTRLTVPRGMSMLDALLEHGVDVDYSCTAGVCGSCRVDVLEGEPEHRDSCLSDTERASSRCVLVCCSGSRSPSLVLDL